MSPKILVIQELKPGDVLLIPSPEYDGYVIDMVETVDPVGGIIRTSSFVIGPNPPPTFLRLSEGENMIIHDYSNTVQWKL